MTTEIKYFDHMTSSALIPLMCDCNVGIIPIKLGYKVRLLGKSNNSISRRKAWHYLEMIKLSGQEEYVLQDGVLKSEESKEIPNEKEDLGYLADLVCDPVRNGHPAII